MFNWIKRLMLNDGLPEVYTKEELKEMSKIDLEKIGRQYGIELDRRLTKTKLINQLMKVMPK